ncbi:MAG: bis(5'-nucleosyl)-tetraphosphatase (symmetrical) YqeK [Peptostreptococcaceae bacterium]|nr:bis(5'-nucleosyl)-tetraphosphatase (symmetrical) YqeK [Peptostreptococcaceae bacterium]
MKTNCINDFLENNLTPEKLMHTEGVISMAVKLAEIYGADITKARIAGKYHDMAKCFDDGMLDGYIEYYSLPENYIGKPNISHAKVAAEMMRDKYSIKDKEILNAVSYHTTGRAGMMLLEEIIYVADAIEVNRNYEGVELLRDLALKDLDGTCLKIINSTIDRVNSKDMYLDEDTYAAKKYIEDKIKEDINGK